MKTILQQLRDIEKDGGAGTLKFPNGKSLDVSNLGKEYFPKSGHTKGDVMRYYAAVAPYILPHLKDRPLVLRRFPDGVDEPPFYQQNAPKDAPKSVRVVRVKSDKGMSPRLIGGDLPTLLYTVQLGAIDVHPWLSRLKTLHAADFCVLDLDPTPKAPFSRVVQVARWVGELLKKAKYKAMIKTSGSRGIHIFVPMPARTSYAKAQEFGRTIATELAERHPAEATVQRMKAKRRVGSVYVDFLQNSEGKSVAAPFSVRPRGEGTVSMPIAWKELTAGLRLEMFTLDNAVGMAKKRSLLWRVSSLSAEG